MHQAPSAPVPSNTPRNSHPFRQTQVPAGRNRNRTKNSGVPSKYSTRRRRLILSGLCSRWLAEVMVRLSLLVPLVADLPQEVHPPIDLPLVLDTLGGEPVHHARDAPAWLSLGQDDPGGVGRGAEDAAHFRHQLQRVQHVQGVKAVAQEGDFDVSVPEKSPPRCPRVLAE